MLCLFLLDASLHILTLLDLLTLRAVLQAKPTGHLYGHHGFQLILAGRTWCLSISFIEARTVDYIRQTANMRTPAALEPLAQVVETLRHLAPTRGWWKRPRFNFITIHYFYLIGMSILGSLILFAGGMPYIDALFFAGGAATQSGLNTIDVNLLYLYQQIILMMWACVTTPVFINTVVVFVRLYWFEKRFKHIVAKERENRKTWERSRSKSEARADPDLSRLEQGVNGRRITVLHETTRPNGMTGHSSQSKEEATQFAEKMGLTDNEKHVDSSESSSGSSDHKPIADSEGTTLLNGTKGDHQDASDSPLNHRTITFPDELPHPHADLSQHIAIVQRQQQNAKSEGGTLRIPGPRDFDRGEKPEEIDESPPVSPPKRRNTADSQEQNFIARMLSRNSDKAESHGEDRPRHAIKFNEPDRRPHTRNSEDNMETRSNKGVLERLVSPLRHRRSGSGLGDRKSTFARTFTNLSNALSHKEEEIQPYFSWQATIGRNSAFVNLTASQREELGGIEYRALKLLAKILIGYYVGFHVFGMMVYLPWIIYTQPWRDIVIDAGASPSFWGIFTAASMFNDLGLTLTSDSMISFNTATLILLIGSFLIIIGNTGFPVMLRFVIWLLTKFSATGSPMSDELRFLLDHPRRCFTLLFPSRANWWLFWILVLLNGIDLVFFIILDLNDPTVTDLPPGFRVLNGWFQATSTRTAGFSSVNIANLHPGIQVSYLIMMYISVLPIAISVRRTNVYEEKSLGIWGGENEEAGMEDPSYVGQHLRRQLSFDLWYIFLGLFIISIVEGPRLSAMDDPAFSMFAVLFEIVSAYGTVGLSLGYPTINASFSAELHTISKLVIVAMMIRGRHRGLPYALDRAILLPSEKQYMKEAEDADRRHERRGSTFPGQNPNFGSSQTWEDGELDENGLPRQRIHMDAVDPMSAGAGGERRPLDRRGSTFSSASGKPRTKGKSLATLLSMGLTAGPTLHKDD